MGGETGIRVEDVTMEFRRAGEEPGSLKELLVSGWRKRRPQTFRALDQVSFTVEPGEVMGIVGANGSGKSTLLKLIAGVLAPTAGRVVVDHSRVQLLTLGTGFDPELTGRENLYLGGAILGYTKEHIDRKYREIVAFAELEGFLEEKVRSYSSGMVSRLGCSGHRPGRPGNSDSGRGPQRGGHVLSREERGPHPGDDPRGLHGAAGVPRPGGHPEKLHPGPVAGPGTAAETGQPGGGVRRL